MRGRWLKGRTVYLDRRRRARVVTLLESDGRVVLRVAHGLFGRTCDVWWVAQPEPRRRIALAQAPQLPRPACPLLGAAIVAGRRRVGRCSDVFFEPSGVIGALMVSFGLWADFTRGRSMLPVARVTFTPSAIVVGEA